MSPQPIDPQVGRVHVPPVVHHYVHVIILRFTSSAASAFALIRHTLLGNCFVPFPPSFLPTP